MPLVIYSFPNNLLSLQCIFMLIFVHLTVLCLERYWNINIMPFLWFLFLCRIHCLLCSVSRPDQGNRNWEKLRREWLISRERKQQKKKILSKREQKAKDKRKGDERGELGKTECWKRFLKSIGRNSCYAECNFEEERYRKRIWKKSSLCVVQWGFFLNVVEKVITFTMTPPLFGLWHK